MALLEYKGVDLSSGSTWALIVQFAIIFVAILFSNVLRRKIKFIKNSLLPASVIAGVLIFALMFIPAVDNLINKEFMEKLTYHCLGLGFIAVALKTSIKKKENNKGAVLDTGITTVNGYLIQGIVGLGLSIVLSVTVFKKLFYASGLLLPMGYGQGTGQALNIGNVFATFGFSEGPSFGLAIAAIGFLVACIVGVIYLNVLKRKGKLVVQQQRIDNNKLDDNIFDEEEAPLSESVDKLTIQVGFIFGVYLMTYLLILGLSTLSTNYLGKFGTNTLKPLLWGFNFLFGTILAIFVKFIVKKLREKKIMKYVYINNFMMNRLSGLFFDVMIVAGIAAIDWQNLQGLLWPLLIICIVGGIATFIYIKFIAKKIFPNYEYEMFFSMFGMLTGTASTGMILLREIDPNYETPASNLFVLSQFPAMISVAPLLLLLNFAGKSFTNAVIAFAIFLVLFIGYTLFLFRTAIFKKKKKSD